VATNSNPLLALQVPIGFGFMNASWPGSPVLDGGAAREGFIGALHAAMDAGVTLFDTADIYAPSWDTMGHNELLLAEAVRTWNGTPEQKARLILATKGGIARGAGEAWSKDSSLDYLLTAVEKSRANLGVEVIPLWQQHRLDTHQTLGDQLQVLKKLKAVAPIRWLGVSNYSADQLRVALDVLGGPADGGIVSVQNQLNPAYRQQLDVLEVCEKHGLAFLPWSPMKGVRGTDARTDVFEIFSRAAEAVGATTYAVAQAWLRSLSPNVIPLPGVTRVESVLDSLAAVNLRLGDEQLALLANLPESAPLDAELVSDQPLAG
jgi:aryl-alcohol dehydrogenase-like predicted oxidoreductase